MQPIWNDYDVLLDLFATSAADFSVERDIEGVSAMIYKGVSHSRPNGDAPIARINDIAAPLLHRGLTFLGEEDVPSVELSVTQYEPGDGSGHPAAEVEFYADWSYDPDYDPSRDGMNFPICDIILPGQYVPCTCSGYNFVTFHLGLSDVASGQFNADFNADFRISNDSEVDENIDNEGAFKTAWLNLADFPTAVEVQTSDPESGASRHYRVGGGCGQYALYYVNAYGGWDTLAVLAKTKKEDVITHHTTENTYNNSKTHARGRVNYVNEIVHKFTFHTHYLTDEQSARMHHLLNSPTVYLHDVAAGHIWSVVLTGNTHERKQNGLNQYAIEAELAQNRIRR